MLEALILFAWLLFNKEQHQQEADEQGSCCSYIWLPLTSQLQQQDGKVKSALLSRMLYVPILTCSIDVAETVSVPSDPQGSICKIDKTWSNKKTKLLSTRLNKTTINSIEEENFQENSSDEAFSLTWRLFPT